MLSEKLVQKIEQALKYTRIQKSALAEIEAALVAAELHQETHYFQRTLGGKYAYYRQAFIGGRHLYCRVSSVQGTAFAAWRTAYADIVVLPVRVDETTFFFDC